MISEIKRSIKNWSVEYNYDRMYFCLFCYLNMEIYHVSQWQDNYYVVISLEIW